MNIHSNSPDREEVQWQSQERARLAARDGGADVADASDLRVARALRQVSPIDLPMDFAAQIAGLVRGQATNNSMFEQHLLRGLLIAFGASGLATFAWLGRSWPTDLAAILPGGSEAVSWSLAAGACVLANWAFALLRRGRSVRGHRPA